MSGHALVLTRCPLHGRRFHRHCMGSQSIGDAIRRLAAIACCEHLRYRRWRIWPGQEPVKDTGGAAIPPS